MRITRSRVRSLRYAELVYYGLWFTALREALDAFFTSSQKYVTGKVGLSLYKGNVNVTSRQSPYSLFQKDLASFGDSARSSAMKKFHGRWRLSAKSIRRG